MANIPSQRTAFERAPRFGWLGGWLCLLLPLCSLAAEPTPHPAQAIVERAAIDVRTDPEASRRNVERALRRIDELRRAQAEQQREMKRTSKSDPEPLPPPDQPEPEPGTEQAPHEPQVAPLPPEQVQRLFDRLLAKEREKLAQREAERSSRPSTVERDW